jgi:nitronate monooxygenase
MSILAGLGVALPIVQAPMAGTSTPALAAAVCNAGALGSIAVGATDAAGARVMIEDLRRRTDRPFNVNLFVHAPDKADPVREAAWLAAVAPEFARYGATPPTALREIYRSFATDDAMLEVFLELAPPVVSFHFGLPDRRRIDALKARGCVLLSTATSLAEAEAAKAAGIDGLVAQGWEAGGHRGVFDPAAPDDRLGVMALTRLLVERSGLPVIAAGGLMDGAGVAAVLALGAEAAQLGTAFIGCPESAADEPFRAALFSDAAFHTTFTDAISGRLARCLANRFTAFGEATTTPRAGYPMTYDAGKALNAAAKLKGEGGYGAQWAGQGAPLARAMPAGELIEALANELAAARQIANS